MPSTKKITQEESVIESSDTSSIETGEVETCERVEELQPEELKTQATREEEVVEPLRRVTVQKAVETKESFATEVAKTEKSKKKRPVFLRLIQFTLLGVTIGFGYEVANFFYFEPMKNAGTPVYGTRLDALTPISETQQTDLKKALTEIKGVQSVHIQIQGASIYTTLTIEPDSSLKSIQSSTASALTDWISDIGQSLVEGYAIQCLVTTPELDELVETNREAEAEYIKTHKIGIVEMIIAHTEKYPTATNIQRSQANINILIKKYPEEATAFQTRIDQLKEYTAEEEAELEIPELIVDQTVPTSDLTEFPSWGVYNLESSTATWY